MTKVSHFYHPGAGPSSAGLFKRLGESPSVLWSILVIIFGVSFFASYWYWDFPLMVLTMTLLLMTLWRWADYGASDDENQGSES